MVLMPRYVPTKEKNIIEKVKMLVTAIFFFSNNDLKREEKHGKRRKYW